MEIIPDSNTLNLQEIAKFPFFYDLQTEDFHDLVQFLEKKTLEPGRYVFKEGDESKGMYFLLEGMVKVKKRIDDGSEILLAEVGSLQIFGEMALIGARRRIASVISLTDLKFFELSCENFEKLCLINPHLGLNIVKKTAHSLSLRLKTLNDTSIFTI